MIEEHGTEPTQPGQMTARPGAELAHSGLPGSSQPGFGWHSATAVEVSDWAANARSGWTSGTTGDPFNASGRSGGSRRPVRMALAAVAAVAVLGAVGVGGYAAYEKVLGGGGPQPESALPATALAFAKIDLDPSSSQKIDALRFARKFPSAPSDVSKDDADLRKVIFDGLQKQGQLKGLTYGTDVEPWLGNRFGLALLPGATGAAPVPVVALAVTDGAKAKAGLAKVGSDAHCSVTGDFALCGADQAVVDAAAAAAGSRPLSEDKGFTGDMSSLGKGGIVTFWSDLGGLGRVVTGLTGVSSPDASQASGLKGRVAGTLRFDAANLEVVAKQFGASKELAGGKAGTEVGNLPADTLVALGVVNGAAQVKAQWGQVAAQPGLSDTIAKLKTETGFVLPDDLGTLLGSSFTAGFGGLDADGKPEVALRTDSPVADVQRLADKVAALGADAPTLTVTSAKGGTIASLSSTYAAKVASGSGLAGTEAFKAAVPDAGSAQAVLFVDVPGLVKELGGDLSQKDRAGIEVLRSFGMSAQVDGDTVSYRLRLVTS